MDHWWPVIAAFVAGGLFGMFVLGLCHAASESDRQSERMSEALFVEDAVCAGDAPETEGMA